jgi:hypothetical protein
MVLTFASRSPPGAPRRCWPSYPRTPDGAVIGGPIFGAFGQTWMIPLIRAVRTPDGAFAGGVVVALADAAGRVLARHVGGEAWTPNDSDRIQSVSVLGPGTNVWVNRGRLDGIERIYAARRVRDFDLRVGIGTATSEALAPLVPRPPRDSGRGRMAGDRRTARRAVRRTSA